jgi:hypoxanthine phosphoribosyltransferase
MHVIRGKKIEQLFTAEMIAKRMDELAGEIASGPTKDLLVIAILKGSFIFAADLIRSLHHVGLAPEVEFITLSSYGTGTISKGVRIVKDIDSDVKDRDVLLIDDILESGRTLTFARDLLQERGARHVSIAVLLDKHASPPCLPFEKTPGC